MAARRGGAGLALAQILAVYRVLPGVCGALSLGAVASLVELSLHTTEWFSELTGWALMVVAMMPPLMSSSVNHVLNSSLPRRRARGAFLTLLSYGSVWILAGLAVVPLAIAVLVTTGAAAFPLALLFAVVWSCSPIAQRARNACHRMVRIGLKGWTADRDCLRQGRIVGSWCVIVCWPWMLAAMLAGAWHIFAMAAITVVLLIDRLQPASPVRWRAPHGMGSVIAASLKSV